MPHVHLDRERDRDLYAVVLDRLPAHVRHPGHMDEQVVGPEPERAAVPTLALGEQVQGGANAERREDMRRDLEPELAPDLPSFLVARKVDLAAHDHGDELVGRREPLFLDADRVVRVLVAGIAADNGGPPALEKPESRTTPRIEPGLDAATPLLPRALDLP